MQAEQGFLPSLGQFHTKLLPTGQSWVSPWQKTDGAAQLSWDLVLLSHKCCSPGFQVAPQAGVAGRGTALCSQGCSPAEHSSSPQWQPCRGVPSLPFPWVAVPGPQGTMHLPAVREQSAMPLGSPAPPAASTGWKGWERRKLVRGRAHGCPSPSYGPAKGGNGQPLAAHPWGTGWGWRKVGKPCAAPGLTSAATSPE